MFFTLGYTSMKEMHWPFVLDFSQLITINLSLNPTHDKFLDELGDALTLVI